MALEHNTGVGGRADEGDRPAQGAGCERRDILSQFMVESGLLGLVGGVAGIATGVVLAKVIGRWMGVPVAASVQAALLALAFALAVGVGFGLYPANRAAPGSHRGPADGMSDRGWFPAR